MSLHTRSNSPWGPPSLLHDGCQGYIAGVKWLGLLIYSMFRALMVYVQFLEEPEVHLALGFRENPTAFGDVFKNFI